MPTKPSVLGLQGATLRVEQQRTAALVHNAAVSQLIACSLGPWQPTPVDLPPPPPPPPAPPPAAAWAPAYPPVDPALLRAGTVRVKLLGAAGLKATDLNGKSDPYAVLSLGGKQHKSTVVSKTLSPRWDETFSFEGTLGDLTSEPLQLELFDKDRITRDDSLGTASVSLRDLLTVREKALDVQLSGKGSVSLVITWTAHGDAPPPVDPALLRTGTVRVKLLSAVGLKAADLNGKSDPYAVLSLGGKQHKSTVVSKTLSPRWDETFSFEGTLGDLTSESLQLELFDKDRITRDDSLGTASVSLRDLLTVREKAFDVQLSGKGSVSLVITWTAHGDAPPPVDPALLRTGTVRVKLLSAAGLKAADLNGKSDPYAVLSLGGKQHKSTVVSKTLSPRWDETFSFEGTLGDLTSESLQLELFDKDRITRDDSLGTASVSLRDLLTVREKALDVQLSGKGSVSLVITWTVHGDAPPPVDPALLRTGTVRVKLLSAVGLKAGDLNGKSDPYAVLSLGGKQHKSTVVSKTLSPRWDETFSFEGTLGDLTSESLQLELFDKDRITRDDSLGTASVSLRDLLTVREKALDVQLSGKGSVSLVITWTAHGDAPPPVDPALLRPGMVRVKLLSAAGLRAADLNGKSDPYAVLSLGGKQHKSTVVSKTLSPRWDETFSFEGTLGDLTSESLQLELFDKDRITRDDSLGTASVSLHDLLSVREKALDVQLSGKGSVSLIITWTAHGDAPPPVDPALLRTDTPPVDPALLRTGTVRVKLLSAAGLKAADLNGKSDPYAVLSLGGKKHKSTVVSKTLSPRWDETFSFEGTLGDLTSEPLQLELFDKDRITRDDSLGMASVSLRDLLTVREKALDVQLSGKGSVSLVITWTAHGDAPPQVDPALLHTGTWTAHGDAPPPVDPALLHPGTVRVKLLSAVGLKAADLNGKSDPYAVLSLGGKQHKSTVVSKTLSPCWDETFSFEGTLGDLTSESLQLELFDKDRITRDDSLGTASVSLRDLLTVREKALDVQLSGKGSVLLVITWTAHGDAPPPVDPALLRTGTWTAHGDAPPPVDPALLRPGMVRVKLLSAAGLRAADLNGKSDPYAVLSLGGKQHKSTVVSKTLSPRWDETFSFEGTLGDLTSESLQLELFDKDRITRDESLGTASVSLRDLLTFREKAFDVQLSGKGSVSLTITWIVNGDAPPPADLLRRSPARFGSSWLAPRGSRRST